MQYFIARVAGDNVEILIDAIELDNNHSIDGIIKLED